MQTLKKDVWKKLKILRFKNDMTQKDVANHLNIDESSYNLKENKKRPFTVIEIIGLLKLFPEATFEDIFLD